MRNKRKNGFILIIVVSIIPLIAVIAAVLSVNSRNLLVQTRLEELALRSRTAFESGLAWAQLHANELEALTANEPVMLMPDGSENVTCVITCVSRDSSGIRLHIKARAQDSRFTGDYEKDVFIAKP